MNGMTAACVRKHGGLPDSPVSSNFLKRLWWRYSQSAHRTSPPPRLLLVLLLSAQILFLAIVRLGPSGALWTVSAADGFLQTSSSMSAPLLVGRAMSLRRPLKFLPQESEDSLLLPDGEREFLMSSHSLPSSSSPSSTSSSTTTSTSSPSSSPPSFSVHDFKDSTMTTLADEPKIADVPSDASTRKIKETPTLTDFTNNLLPSIEDELVSEPAGSGASPFDSSNRLSASEEMVSPSDSVVSLTTTENKGIKGVKRTGTDVFGGVHNAAAMATSSVAAKKEQALIAKKVSENVPGEGGGQRFVEERRDSSECKYGYIYVYDLPPIFNYDIIANCTALNVFVDVCHTLLNDGLGASLGNSSPLGQTGSWFISDQFTTEVVFHNRILQHPCRTDKPEQASGFYVPYYAGLDVGRYLWAEFSAERRDRVGNQLLEWLGEQQAWKSNGGWGHFMMVGRITWDFRRSKDEDWGSGHFYHPSMQNMTRLLIERNPWDYMEMAVPYPTNFHPQSDSDLITWQNHIRSTKRNNLFSFAGAPRSTFPNDFRGILLDQCQQAQSCQCLDCSNRTCDDNQKTLELFMDSSFCLQPRGDSFTRRSTFDCLLAGSIPVFFWHRSAYMQYKWHLPEDVASYSVFISKEDMRNGTKIEDVLNSFSTERVQAMREAVIDMVPRVVYAVSGFSLKEQRDAFDVAIEGVMKRFKELKLRSQRR